MTPLLIGAGINQRYVVELTATSRIRYRAEVDAASATEAETLAWGLLEAGELPAPEVEHRPFRTDRVRLADTDERGGHVPGLDWF